MVQLCYYKNKSVFLNSCAFYKFKIFIFIHIKIYIERTGIAKNLSIPRYKTPGSSGMDLNAAIEKDILLEPLSRKLIPTGISICHITLNILNFKLNQDLLIMELSFLMLQQLLMVIRKGS